MQDGQAWFQVLALGELSDHYRAHLELQPRVFDNASELGLTIARAAVGRRLSPAATAFLGYAWVPRTLGPGVQHERRIWQQLSLTLPRQGRWAPSARIRLEQRRLDPWDNTSHRLRLLMRTQRPLTGGPWSLALYNETMITLDTTESGPARGYDRNRAYGGLMRRMSSALTAEFGYIWENSTIPGPLQRNDHVGIAVLNVSFSLRR